MRQEVINQCQYARNMSSICCDEVIGGDLCNDLMEFCYVDVCILADGEEGFIPIYVLSQFTKVVNFICGIPDIGIQQDPSNLTPAPTNKPSETPAHTDRPYVTSVSNQSSDTSAPSKYLFVFAMYVIQLLF